MDNFKAFQSKISDILSKRDVFYVVPRYQRQYSWKEEHINDFWEDLSDEDPTYFLGTLVFNLENYHNKKTKDIIDGQQRLLTITIALAVIRDLFFQLKDRDKSKHIQENYIANTDDDNNSEFKLRPGKGIKDYFLKYIQNEKGTILESRPVTGEEKQVKKNYEILRKEIENKINEFESNEKKIIFLQGLRDKIKNLEIVVIEVEKEEDAFVFFETLNARGLELQTADVLKNLIFKKLQNRENNDLDKDIEQKWETISENLAYDEDETDVTKFIRHYWLSTYKKITEKKLFSEIKNTITNWEQLLSTLQTESFLYRKILYPVQNDWRSEYLTIFKCIKNIKRLNVKQPYSIMLALLRVLDKRDYDQKYKTKMLIDAFIWLENFTFSFTTITGKSPSPLENIYSHYAIKISSVKNKRDLENILINFKKKLKQEFPQEEEFISNFKSISYSTKKKQIDTIKYILERINYAGVDEQLFDNVEVEHIIPQNPGDGWGLTREAIREYVNNIGNLLILGPEYNKRASSKPINEKIAYYEGSTIKMTKDFAEFLKTHSDWQRIDVDNRAKELAKLAWELWKI